MCGVLASVLLRTPLLRHLYFSLGLRAADSKSIKHIITREHASCQIIVGGIAEMFMADDPRYERVYLRRRTGCAPSTSRTLGSLHAPDRCRSALTRARPRRSFVRLAIKNGTPLVPVFYFGASRTLSKFSPAWLEQVSRKLKISLLGFYGRWYVPVPYARPIKMAVGRAIEVRASPKMHFSGLAPKESSVYFPHRCQPRRARVANRAMSKCESSTLSSCVSLRRFTRGTDRTGRSANCASSEKLSWCEAGAH